MLIKDLVEHIENWAPPEIAWENDNIGLQIGSPNIQIKNILLALELSSKVVDDAIKKRCNLIITHHPLIFTPLKSINYTHPKSELIKTLIKNDINLYSAHTNLDFTKDGVSFQLARQLKLINIKFLKKFSNTLYKIVVFVPEAYVEKLANAMHNAGAGQIGEYSNCSFRLKGTGTFKGSDSTNPFLGQKDKLEFVDEIRLEMICNSFKLNNVITAMKLNHPYEEVAFDIYKLYNEEINYGVGAIGYLGTELNENDFLNYLSKSLKIKHFRYSKGNKNKIKKVAVCGGSGSDLLNIAINNNADAFITSDIKYHNFQEAENKVLLVDAGHYQTEIFILSEIERRINKLIKDKNIQVFKFKGSTDPINFYNNFGGKIV